jgi:hypothetical protein
MISMRRELDEMKFLVYVLMDHKTLLFYLPGTVDLLIVFMMLRVPFGD